MSSTLRKKARSTDSGSGSGVTNFSLVRKGAKFWNSLPWKSIDVSKSHLGEFEDAVFFGLEEVDGNAFVEFKKQQKFTQEDEGALVDEEVIVPNKKDKKKKRKRDEEEIKTAQQIIDQVEVVDSPEQDSSQTKKAKKDKKDKKNKKEKSKLAKIVDENDKLPQEEWSSGDEVFESVEDIKREPKGKKQQKKKNEQTKNNKVFDDTPYALEEVGDWGGIEMNGLLCKSLQSLDFVKPTPIQSVAIPKIIANRMDVVGVAETGSGKTLAFGIPIVHFLLENWDLYRDSFAPSALIISPTRELAMQTTTVLTDICKPWKDKSKHSHLRINISIAAVVGGMSEHKQKRLLNQVIHIIVATPGRLCEVMEDDSLTAFQDLSRLRFLVVDEADRIMEEGHFAELNRVFSRIRDHESISAKGEDVRVVMWRRKQGIPESTVDGIDNDEDDQGILDMGMNDFDANLGPMAADIERMIAEQKARGEVVDQPYDSDDEVPLENEEENIDDGDEEQEIDMDVDEEEEGGEGEEEDIENMVMDEDQEGEAEGEGEVYAEDIEEQEMLNRNNSSFSPSEIPDFPPMPPFIPSQRQTLLFSATGLAARANLHRTELAQLKKLKLRGTIVGVVTDFLLPLSLKKLFAEVGIQKKIEVVDATRSRNQQKARTSEEDTEQKKSHSSHTETVSQLAKKSRITAEEDDNKDAAEDFSLEKSAISVLPKQLSQYEIRVPTEDKDVYLYYYLAQYPGRRIVIFVNSIKTCRRVDGLLRALGLPCKPLHAELPQRTRLQNLDFLKTQPQAILVATDVAARGVDVDRIATVIHYDVARSPQVYIHRSGRTARNGQTGEALSLVSPDDLSAHHVITKYLFSYQRVHATPAANSSKKSNVMMTEKALPAFSVQMLIIPALRDRVLLARKIFSLSAQQSRASKEAHWAHQQAKEADLLVEGDDMEPDYAIERDQFAEISDELDEAQNQQRQRMDDENATSFEDSSKKPLSKQAKRELAILKQELQSLLERPLGSLAGTMRSSTGLLLQHQQYQSSSTNPATVSRKHGKKARKAKASVTTMMAANDWRKRKNGFFVYAR